MSGYCGGGRRSRVSSEFVGVSPDTLQQWLTDAQATLQQLETSKNVNSVSYSQDAGTKSVTYQQGDADKLRQRIQRLAMALGLVDRRRAMNPGF